MDLLSVDPGLRASGVALFKDNLLVAADYVRSSSSQPAGPESCAEMAENICLWLSKKFVTFEFSHTFNIVVEWPQVYRGTTADKDPNDLLGLAGVTSALVAFSDVLKNEFASKTSFRVTHYLPKEWKGQMTKEASRYRIQTRLSGEELGSIERKCRENHNTWDAIGIGLKFLDRFERKRAFAR